MTGPASPTLLVVAWRFPVFSETYVVDHLAAMLDRGWRVSLACVELDEGALIGHGELAARLERLTAFGDEVAHPGRVEQIRRTVSEGQWRSPRSVVAGHAARLAPVLRREIVDAQPDVVHAHFGPNAAAAALAVGGDRTPIVADLHGYDITELPRSEGWGAYRRLLAGTTVVVHSRFAAGLVRDGLGVEPDVVPYDASPAFTPVDRPRGWSAPLRLLFVGRLVPEKGADLAVAALAHLRARRPDLDPRLTVIGQGPAGPDLRARARQLDVEESVSFTGASSHHGVARAMAGHDVLLVPSRPSPSGWVETFGLVAAEGARAGLGVVVSRTGGLPESAGPAGVVVEPDDPIRLSEGVERLLDRGRAATTSASTGTVRKHGTADGYDRVARRVLEAQGRSTVGRRPADR